MRAALLLATTVLLLTGTAAAQAPTQAQTDAVRSSCRSDFLRHCSGVPRGGKEALACLKSHQDKLSPACAKAVSAIP